MFKKITKINFLVHPGFIIDERMMGRDIDQKDEQLLDAYVKKAQSLKDNELMVALTYSTRQEFQNDAKTGMLYFQKLREMKKILGDRLIVLSASQDIFDSSEALTMIKRIAKQRGYIFEKDVASEAFGETLQSCVVDAAQNLNEVGEFKKKTKINAGLTNYYTPDRLREAKQRSSEILNNRSRLEFKK
jgi:hypothetical protein